MNSTYQQFCTNLSLILNDNLDFGEDKDERVATIINMVDKTNIRRILESSSTTCFLK